MNREWFAIQTKPRQEQVAKINYERQGYMVYLPVIRKLHRHARRTKQVLKPFFPGYLFLNLAPKERNWVTIASTRGSIGPVHFGERYIPAPAWIIDELRSREDEQGMISLSQLQRQRLASGVRVEVLWGDDDALAEGVFCSFRGKDNALVLLDILQRQVKTTVALSQIKLA